MDIEELKRQLAYAERKRAILRARDNLLDFTHLTMPDPNYPDDVSKSLYAEAPHHVLLAQALERVESGEVKKLAISMPPQHGKSELASRRFIAWFVGRNPTKNLIFATYSGDFSSTFGNQVRSIMRSQVYSQIFPEVKLSEDSQSKTEQDTVQGGTMIFSSREGSVTGRPADIFLIDDLLKDDKEAQSPAALNSCYQFYTKVAYTRLHNDSAQVLIGTRWSENDLIGRLVDPTHPDYDAELAEDWTYINIPSILEAEHAPLAKAMGLKVGHALWPERFSLKHLHTAKKLNPQGFSALYQGSPAPDDGIYWTRDMLTTYGSIDELPKDLHYYGASDHALTDKQANDPNCIGCIGVDSRGVIWVMPDLAWERMEADVTVESILGHMRFRRPRMWFAEGDVIGKAIGPFLRLRMKEEKIYTPVYPVPVIGNKVARSVSIRGRALMGMVKFPSFAPWWAAAQNELLKFPSGVHDDFVDFLSNFGLGLDFQTAAANTDTGGGSPKIGTFAYLKWATKMQEQSAQREQGNGW